MLKLNPLRQISLLKTQWLLVEVNRVLCVIRSGGRPPRASDPFPRLAHRMPPPPDTLRPSPPRPGSRRSTVFGTPTSDAEIPAGLVRAKSTPPSGALHRPHSRRNSLAAAPAGLLADGAKVVGSQAPHDGSGADADHVLDTRPPSAPSPEPGPLCTHPGHNPAAHRSLLVGAAVPALPTAAA